MFRNMKLVVGAVALAMAGASSAATTDAAGGEHWNIWTQGFGTLAFLALMYFLPAVVALYRKHNNKLAIGMLNLFLGWTGLGWIGSLVWACTSNRKAK